MSFPEGPPLRETPLDGIDTSKFPPFVLMIMTLAVAERGAPMSAMRFAAGQKVPSAMVVVLP